MGLLTTSMLASAGSVGKLAEGPRRLLLPLGDRVAGSAGFKLAAADRVLSSALLCYEIPYHVLPWNITLLVSHRA